MALPGKNSLETLLIVEDDPMVLKLVSGILEQAGFCVLPAANSTQAIQVESSFPGTIHLLLSDVMMPDMSGPFIAQTLKKHRPELRVMLMSGYRDGDMLFLNLGWHFIEKPFLAAELVTRVNEVLHTPERSQGDAHFDNRIEPKASGSEA
jgi:DNA-binding response OmpR family regulator